MIRYTAKINVMGNTVEIAQIKKAISDAFLFAPYSCTFRFGTIAQVDERNILVEFKTDLSKDNINKILQQKCESNLPIKLEKVGWGWLLSKPSLDNPVNSDSDPNIISNFQPQAEIAKDYLFRDTEILRLSFSAIVISILLFLFFIGVLAIISSLIIMALRPPTVPYTPGIFSSFPIPFMFLLLLLLLYGRVFSTPYLDFVRCDEAGIEIKHLAQSTPKRLAWTEIECLEVSNGTVYIRTASFTERMVINPLLKMDYDTLIITVVVRASLHYLGNSFFNPIYKSFDAK